MGMTLVVRNGLLFTMAPHQPDPFVGWMEVGDDGRILAIGVGPYAGDLGGAAQVIDATGKFIAPGFVSAHSHLHTSGTRGIAVDKSLYEWVAAMTAMTRNATAEDFYWFTLHGALDFLNNGITTAYDFTPRGLDFTAEGPGHAHIGGRLRGPEYGEGQVRAKVDAGIRFVNSVSLDDTATDDKETLARLDHIVEYTRSLGASQFALASAISGAVQWSPHRSTAEIEVEAMERHGLINQPHLLETPYSIEEQRAKLAWYRDAGAFGPKLLFGHFVQATDEQIVEVAEAGCGAVWQPTSNGRLASGVADVPRWLELGMRVGVGLDDQACTDVSDPFQNMRIGIYLQRAWRKDPTAMGPRKMLELHTRTSAEVLGVADRVGSLEPGKFADFLVVDPADPDTGPVWDPYGTYVLACSLRNLKQVWVGGRLVSDEGRIVSHDMRAVSAEVHGRLRSLTGTTPIC